jgi:hypothetical protein
MKQILLFASFIGLSSLASAQLSSINENFDSFISDTPSFPQNNWTMNVPTAFQNYMMVINEDGSNKFVQAYAFTQVNVPHYLISPQIVAPDGTKTLSFEASKFTQSGFMGTVEAGLVSSPTDMASFTSLGAAVTLQTTTPQTFTYTVPASSQQYIAFKFVGLNNHASTKLDNVIYGSGNLSVNDTKKTDKITFAVKGNNLIFVGKASVREIKVYNIAGRRIQVSQNSNSSFDISELATGIYIFETQNDDGTVLKSKFIKK